MKKFSLKFLTSLKELYRYLKFHRTHGMNAFLIRLMFTQCSKVLEKHLVISGNYTMSDLKKIANDTYLLPTARGGLSIRVRDDVNGKCIRFSI